jgi:hypothetical protein
MLINWIAGWILVYATLFGVGTILFTSVIAATPYAIAATIAAVIINRNLSKQAWSK